MVLEDAVGDYVLTENSVGEFVHDALSGISGFLWEGWETSEEEFESRLKQVQELSGR